MCLVEVETLVFKMQHTEYQLILLMLCLSTLNWKDNSAMCQDKNKASSDLYRCYETRWRSKSTEEEWLEEACEATEGNVQIVIVF